jgi:hypothetical protein
MMAVAEIWIRLGCVGIGLVLGIGITLVVISGMIRAVGKGTTETDSADWWKRCDP